MNTKEQFVIDVSQERIALYEERLQFYSAAAKAALHEVRHLELAIKALKTLNRAMTEDAQMRATK